MQTGVGRKAIGFVFEAKPVLRAVLEGKILFEQQAFLRLIAGKSETDSAIFQVMTYAWNIGKTPVEAMAGGRRPEIAIDQEAIGGEGENTAAAEFVPDAAGGSGIVFFDSEVAINQEQRPVGRIGGSRDLQGSDGSGRPPVGADQKIQVLIPDHLPAGNRLLPDGVGIRAG